MINLMAQLITDHKNLKRLLDILDSQVKSFILNTDEDENDFAILLETLEYISVYPQKWHHPAEELVFRYLLKHDLTDAERVSVTLIKEQHRSLDIVTDSLQSLFLTIANGSIVPMENIADRFCNFLDLQNEHIETENMSIFPLMAQKITAQEWLEIGSQLDFVSDPLFNQRARYEYNALYRFLSSVNEDLGVTA